MKNACFGPFETGAIGPDGSILQAKKSSNSQEINSGHRRGGSPNRQYAKAAKVPYDRPGPALPLSIPPDAEYRHGRSTIYPTFLFTVMVLAVQTYVIPPPLDSNTAGVVIDSLRVAANSVDLDSGHNYRAVTNHLQIW